ncbi:MAG: hypothetical protein AAGC74_11235 [Verrucomicrobiota bacterium]
MAGGPVYWGMTGNWIRVTAAAIGALILVSCADPYYSNGYGGDYSSPHSRGVNHNQALAVAGAVVAGAALIGYANERSKRKALEDKYYHQGHYGHGSHRGYDRGYHRRGYSDCGRY